MSRRILWLTIVTSILVALAIIVYSKQAGSGNGQPAPRDQSRIAKPTANSNESPAQAASPGVPPQICSLNVARAPDINGLKLGMTTEEVLAGFPGSRDDAEIHSDLSRPPQYGGTRFIIRPEKFGLKEKFSGIKKITFTFFDGRVSGINAGYDGPEWKNVDEFVAKFSEGKILPPANEWQAAVGMDTQLKTLKCSGFELSVFAGGPGGNINYVQLRDVAAEKELGNRRKKAREKAEKEGQVQ
jgi:hypothetical protein